ncbi:hypothetical protein Ocin01_08323 [Orchesella cincta]|uniref:F-box domain-containing protein n=1 Tax=Orchesella cincta TaxID=48709 RepID=A0A1D2MZE3_ORCCI|nr:hypothetical protein Ocin01_08323 [Orchesella cincta]
MRYNLNPKGTVCTLPTTLESSNVLFQPSLEFIPDEISIWILENLNKKDILSCRIVSSVMRKKIDRLFYNQLCVALTQNQLNQLNQKPKLNPCFNKMRLLNTPFFSSTKLYKLRKEYFVCVTDLELSGAINPRYFQQILKMTPFLRILRLNSNALGGANNLFREMVNSCRQKLGCYYYSPLYRMSAFLKNTLFGDEFRSRWENLDELHIKIDYIMPSKTFSPLDLLQNLQDLHELPVKTLSVFTCTVEESDQKEMFYFTLSSLLKMIPYKAFNSLKFVSIMVPKCRPENKNFNNSSPVYENTAHCILLPFLQLSQLFLQISSGYHHPIPRELERMLRVQKSMKRLTIGGIRDVTLPNIIDEMIYKNNTSLKTLDLF